MYENENYQFEENQGMLNVSEEYNTTAPTQMPVIAPKDANYDENDKVFIGVFLILPFTFSITAGALSGYIAHVNEEAYKTVKFQLISKTSLVAVAITTSIVSLYNGGENISPENHLSAVAWILASTPSAFYIVEKGIRYTLAGKIHEL